MRSPVVAGAASDGVETRFKTINHFRTKKVTTEQIEREHVPLRPRLKCTLAGTERKT